MRKSLLFIISFFLFSSLVAHTISYQFKIKIEVEKNGFNLTTTITLDSSYSGTINEGEFFTVPQYTLDSTYSVLQDEYDLFAGSSFLIPEGALNNDIKLVITLDGLSFKDGKYKKIGEFNLFFRVKIDVYSPADAETPIEGHFIFNEGYPLRLTLLSAPIKNYLIKNPALGITLPKIAFGYIVNNGQLNGKGITTTITDSTISFTATHLSTIAGSSTDIVNVKNILNTKIPEVFTLEQNYPNPFNPTTNIRFSLPKSDFITLKVYNTVGSEVSKLISKNMAAGNYEIQFDATNLPSGIYFYTLTGANTNLTKKMILLK